MEENNTKQVVYQKKVETNSGAYGHNKGLDFLLGFFLVTISATIPSYFFKYFTSETLAPFFFLSPIIILILLIIYFSKKKRKYIVIGILASGVLLPLLAFGSCLFLFSGM